jgi:hypothetical protein
MLLASRTASITANTTASTTANTTANITAKGWPVLLQGLLPLTQQAHVLLRCTPGLLLLYVTQPREAKGVSVIIHYTGGLCHCSTHTLYATCNPTTAFPHM